MNCMHCGKNISDEFFLGWSKTEAAKSGRFNCPHCLADHIRRDIGRLPSGQPQHSVRLWGHLGEIRRRKEAKGLGELPK